MDYKYDHGRDYIGKIAPRNYAIEELKQSKSGKFRRSDGPPLPWSKRPVSIIVLSILFLLDTKATVLLSPIMFTIMGLPVWFTVAIVISGLLQGVGAFGLWKMRKWGLPWLLASFVVEVVAFWGLGASLINLGIIFSLGLLIFTFSKGSLLD